MNAYNRFHIAPLQYQNRGSDIYGVRAEIEQILTQEGLQSVSVSEGIRQYANGETSTLGCSLSHRTTTEIAEPFVTVHLACFDVLNNRIYRGSGTVHNPEGRQDLIAAAHKAVEGFSENYTGYDSSISTASEKTLAQRSNSQGGVSWDVGDLRDYLRANASDLAPVEGIWLDRNGAYKIGIRRRGDASSNEYVAAILDAQRLFWKPKQVKARLYDRGDGSSYNVSYFMADYTERNGTVIVTKDRIEINLSRTDADSAYKKEVFLKQYPPVSEHSETALAENSDEISMVKQPGGTYLIPAKINDVLEIRFVLDSGASEVSISPDVAMTLIRTGTVTEDDFIGSRTYKFADGSTATSERFVISEFQVGDRVIQDVTASISNSIDAPMLLGQNVLSNLGNITIDYGSDTLIIESD